MCASQAISNFLNVTSSTVSSLGLFSPDRSSDKPEWAVGRRDVEPPEYMKDFEKNTKDFMEQQAKSRSIERYDPPKSNTRKRRSLGTETLNNIPRNKRRRAKRQTSTSLIGTPPPKGCSTFNNTNPQACLSANTPTYCLGEDICVNYRDFFWDRYPNYRYDSAMYRCYLPGENNPFVGGCSTRISCIRQIVFSSGAVNDPCACIGYSPCTDPRGSKIITQAVECQCLAPQEPTATSSISTETTQGPSMSTAPSQSAPIPTLMPTMTTVHPVLTPTPSAIPEETELPTKTNAYSPSPTPSAIPEETELPTKTNAYSPSPTPSCDKNPFYYAIGTAIAVFGCAVLSTACGLYQCVTKRKQGNREDQSETISPSSTIQNFDKDKEECITRM